MPDYRDKTSDFCEFLRPHFENSFPYVLLLLSIPSSKMSRNMFKLCHKVRNGQIYPLEVQAFQNFYLNSNFAFNFRLSKIYSFNPFLKSTLGLYVFESIWQETKIQFEKSEFNFENFTLSSLSSVAINVNICEHRVFTTLNQPRLITV